MLTLPGEQVSSESGLLSLILWTLGAGQVHVAGGVCMHWGCLAPSLAATH